MDGSNLILFACCRSYPDRMKPGLRQRIERATRLRAEMGETMRNCRATILQSRAILARAKGKPYLVADRGIGVVFE